MRHAVSPRGQKCPLLVESDMKNIPNHLNARHHQDHETGDFAAKTNGYLCQVSDSVSCGACCGLYNLADFSRGTLVSMLKQRTLEFASVTRELSEIVGFGEMVSLWAHKNQPFPEFHHCPYVGLIGPELSKVGCLLHPMAEGNKGIDFRGLSYYGGMACRIYFCPSSKKLPERIKKITLACFDDWYTYGLIITEHEFLAAVFYEIETRLGTQIHLEMLSSDTLSKIYRLLTLKLNWPFRSPDWPIANYFFEDRQYRPPAIDYHSIQIDTSPFHAILQELGSEFSSAQALHQAETMLTIYFDSVIKNITDS